MCILPSEPAQPFVVILSCLFRPPALPSLPYSLSVIAGCARRLCVFLCQSGVGSLPGQRILEKEIPSKSDQTERYKNSKEIIVIGCLPKDGKDNKSAVRLCALMACVYQSLGIQGPDSVASFNQLTGTVRK